MAPGKSTCSEVMAKALAAAQQRRAVLQLQTAPTPVATPARAGKRDLKEMKTVTDPPSAVTTACSSTATSSEKVTPDPKQIRIDGAKPRVLFPTTEVPTEATGSSKSLGAGDASAVPTYREGYGFISLYIQVSCVLAVKKMCLLCPGGEPSVASTPINSDSDIFVVDEPLAASSEALSATTTPETAALIRGMSSLTTLPATEEDILAAHRVTCMIQEPLQKIYIIIYIYNI